MNSDVTGTITSIAFGGSGVLRDEGLVVFVPFTAKGDKITARLTSKKKNFATGKLLHLLSPAQERTPPGCPYFGTCGGCQLQHIQYPSQLDAKRTFILDALSRIGKISIDDVPIHPAGQKWHYRRHIRLSLRKSQEGFIAGYVGADLSVFCAVKECPIFLESSCLFSSLLPFLSRLSNRGIEEASLRIIKTKNHRFLLAFEFSPFLPENFSLAKELITEESPWQGILMRAPNAQKEWGTTHCEVDTLGLKCLFSPYGFVQNHPEQSEHLYRAILGHIGENTRNVLDLYCGIGITSLLLAQMEKKVTGVEFHPETVALAKKNGELNGIHHVEFLEGKAESTGVQMLKKEPFDAVLCNPPRTGMDPALVDALLSQKPPRILYVSCMPSTLARDLQRLVTGGYAIESIQGFDMFPQTTHVETLIVLIPK